MIKKSIAIGIFALLSLSVLAQRTSVFQEAQFDYKQGMDYYDKALYALAQKSFQKAATKVNAPSDHQTEVLKKQTDMMYALSAVRQEQPDGEMLVQNFVRENRGTTMANRALYDLGTYYYAKRQYDDAADVFAQIEGQGLSDEQLAEVRFKQGYGHFIKQRWAAAKTAFSAVRKNKNEYYYPANYYYGMSSFYMKQYKDAVDGFKVASGNRRYAAQVPYYIVQIHFAQKEYDEVISYGETVLKESTTQKAAEIGQMVGQAYFERGEYKRALPYLNDYADRNSNMTDAEFYQVGFVNYSAGNCEKAVQYLRRVSNANNEIGQLSSYYIAECYIKTNEKTLARTSFAKAANMKFRPDIAEDASFNFAKLSVEMNADKDAVQALLKINNQSKYYSEAQDLLGVVLLETRDFDFVIETIERLGNRTSMIDEAYQKATYAKAVELYNSRQYDEALVFFDKSLARPVNSNWKAMSTYWKGEIFHQQKKYDQSIKEFNQFFTLEKVTNIPDPGLIHMANYSQGYNHLKKNEHQTALGFFEKAIEGIKKDQKKIEDNLIKVNIFGDAVLRAGDSHFKRNRYKEASRFYNEAVANKYSGYDYAMFQKALISGLEKNNKQKITQLEELVRTVPKSAYADDALYELSFAYEQDGNPGKGKEVLERLVKEYRTTSNLVNSAYLKLGLLNYNSGNNTAALNNYKAVFQNNPTKEEADAAITAIEEIYVSDLGKPDEYFKFLESIPGYQVKGDAKDSLTFRVAQVQYENGNYDRAITGYTDYLTKYPKGAYALQALYNRGESYLLLKRFSDALKDYELIVARGQNPYYARSLEKAAIISYNHEENFTKAYDYYSKLDELASSNDMRYEAQLGAMRSAYRSGNKSATLSYSDKVLNNSLARPDHKATAHFFKGKTFFGNDEFQKAIPALTEVTKVLDNEIAAESRYLIALAHFKLKSYDNAETAAKEVLNESSDYRFFLAKSLILLSDIYVVNIDYISARAALEAVIENFDEDPAVLQEAKSKLKIVDDLDSKQSKGNQRKNNDEIDFKEFNKQ